ncbi:MAG TPA: hypothetical protein VMX13_13350 [Sedimentisphaerales bacterium]|nr:hypothetical protein [Sedimentisphaerales bacterium]
MFTLIKREIEDHIGYFLGATIFAIATIFVAIAFYAADSDRHVWPAGAAIILFVATAFVTVLGSCAMGVSQMYADRTKRISAFLSALPVTRRQIFAARIITGILAILLFLVPLAVTAEIFFRRFVPPHLMRGPVVAEIFAAVFLMGFACYCLGLQTGWSSGKLAPTLGSLGLTCLLASLIIVKGFGLPFMVIILILIFASVICSWHQFTSTSL